MRDISGCGMLSKMKTFSIAAITLMTVLPAAASAQSFGTNLIVNGDAETGPAGGGGFIGAPAGFTITGELTQVSYDAGGGYPTRTDAGGVAVGDAFFSGGFTTPSTGFQTIDVSNLAGVIDFGTSSYVLSALLGGFSSQGDQATLSVTFNGLAGLLGTTSIGPVTPSDRGDATSLLQRSAGGLLPVGTRSIDVLLRMDRFQGSANDGYADNLSLVLTAGVIPGGVPEPATWAMMIGGVGAVGGAARRRKAMVSVRYA